MWFPNIKSYFQYLLVFKCIVFIERSKLVQIFLSSWSIYILRPTPPQTADTVTHAPLMTSETTRDYPQVCRHGNRVGDYWFVSAVESGIDYQCYILSFLVIEVGWSYATIFPHNSEW